MRLMSDGGGSVEIKVSVEKSKGAQQSLKATDGEGVGVDLEGYREENLEPRNSNKKEVSPQPSEQWVRIKRKARTVAGTR